MGKCKPPLDKKKGNPRGTRRDPRVIARLRSGLEDKVKAQLDELEKEYKYESERIQYTIPESLHTYVPDFVIFKSSGEPIFVEVKGLWSYEDRYKHLLVRRQHPELDIRFVFGRLGNRISSGSRTTYRDVCLGNGRGIFKGVQWKHAEGLIPQEWLNE